VVVLPACPDAMQRAKYLPTVNNFFAGTLNRAFRGFISRRVTLIDPQRAGLPVTVFVQVTLHHQVKKDLDRFAQQVLEWPEVMECYLMTGDFDYLMRVVIPDLQAYQTFLDEKLTAVDGVEHIKSSFSLKPICYKTELPLGHLI
jgi:DNA-binding Lrp family transcriptional regulator